MLNFVFYYKIQYIEKVDKRFAPKTSQRCLFYGDFSIRVYKLHSSISRATVRYTMSAIEKFYCVRKKGLTSIRHSFCRGDIETSTFVCRSNRDLVLNSWRGSSLYTMCTSQDSQDIRCCHIYHMILKKKNHIFTISCISLFYKILCVLILCQSLPQDGMWCFF